VKEQEGKRMGRGCSSATRSGSAVRSVNISWVYCLGILPATQANSARHPSVGRYNETDDGFDHC